MGGGDEGLKTVAPHFLKPHIFPWMGIRQALTCTIEKFVPACTEMIDRESISAYRQGCLPS